eukprot:TRINITY_DN7235_c0_g1_i3.p1 TRINITY_DN7235_c0_g1~~TRINITY_DN7235_c0_g1_i3.p1  ORF type:complete len:130 (+),score=19.64 TRINITY_DN7235_c0_g1_i3:420-809(+)
MHPRKQLEQWQDKPRKLAPLIYVATAALLAVAGLVFESVFIAFGVLLVHFLAYLWYSASYIPYAQGLILQCCGDVLPPGATAAIANHSYQQFQNEPNQIPGAPHIQQPQIVNHGLPQGLPTGLNTNTHK